MYRRSRRSFLRLGAGALGLGAASSLLPLRPVLAGGGSPRHLIIFLAYGGWDPSFCFNPQPDSPEVDMVPGDVQLFGELPIWTDASRPAVSEFFTQWGSRSAVVNGIAVDSLAHETCAKVALTGSALESRPDVAARIADAIGSNKALPYLSLSPHSKVRGLEAQKGELGYSNQIMALSTPQLAWPELDGSYDNDLSLGAAERELVAAYLRDATQSEAEAHAGSARTQKLLSDFRVSLDRADGLQANARSGGLLSDQGLFEETERPWDHVAGAFAEQLSQVAILQPDIYWDTHGYNAPQSDNFEQYFTALNELMSSLSSAGVVDDTVVLCLSEMGRTPRHNSQGGKDHWPWTSAMLIGSNVDGGRAVGTTDEWLRPQALDLATGASRADGVTLHSGHLLATAAKLLGVGEDWYPEGAIDALLG